MMTDYFVYGLTDPTTQKVHYIGRSSNPERRRKHHCYKANSEEMGRWIRGLQAQGEEPTLVLLEGPVKLEEARKLELAWIERGWREDWPLLNAHSIPDDGPHPDSQDLGIPGRGCMSVEQVSVETGYHREHLRRLIREGKLDAERIGWMWFIQPDSLAIYLAQMRDVPQAGPQGNPDSLIAYLKENRGPLGPHHQQGGEEE